MTRMVRHPDASRDPAPHAIRAKPWIPAFAGMTLLILALLLLTFPLRAQTFPAFTGLVVDAANILPADRKAALEAKLEAFQQQTGRQLVVATIPDLQGYPIEDYGYRLGRSWGVGLKDADNGAILLVAPAERKVRIEVGYRLEPVLTDAFSSVIVQQKIIPAFKAGDMPAGIEAGTDAIIAQLGLPDDQAKAQVAKAAQGFDATHRKHGASGGFPLAVIFWVVLLLVFIGAMARGRGAAGGGPWGARRYQGHGSNWPIWLWAASEAMSDHHRGGGGGGIFGGDSGGGMFGGGGGSDGSWGGGGFTGGGGGGFGGGGASGGW